MITVLTVSKLLHGGMTYTAAIQEQPWAAAMGALQAMSEQAAPPIATPDTFTPASTQASEVGMP